MIFVEIQLVTTLQNVYNFVNLQIKNIWNFKIFLRFCESVISFTLSQTIEQSNDALHTKKVIRLLFNHQMDFTTFLTTATTQYKTS